MKKALRKIPLLIAAASLSTTVLAADANNPSWQFDVAPYLWALNMDGRVQTGPLKTHISQDFSQILSQLDAGGMLWVGAHRGPAGAFFNGLYAKLADNGNVGRFDSKMTTDFGIMTVGLSYIVLQKQFPNAYAGETNQIQLEPYAGARYTFNNVRLRLGVLSANNNKNWTDPIVGLKLRYDLTARWLGELTGDMGGTNMNTQTSYNLAGLVGYKPAACYMKNTTFYVGYHYLYQHYQTGSGLNFFDWNMRLFGPVLGVNFSF